MGQDLGYHTGRHAPWRVPARAGGGGGEGFPGGGGFRIPYRGTSCTAFGKLAAPEGQPHIDTVDCFLRKHARRAKHEN